MGTAAHCFEQILELQPTKQQLYENLTPILNTIQVRWIRHNSHCWESKDKLISNVILLIPTHGRTEVAGNQNCQLCLF